MRTEAIGLLGSLMLAGVIAYLWLGRLKDKAPAGDYKDGDVGLIKPGHDSHYHLKLGMPEPQSRVGAVAQKHSSVNVKAANTTENSDISAEAEQMGDCPSAAASLDIAAKLVNIGDFEGVCEIADIVLESAEATSQQKIQARNLKRKCSPR